MRNLRNCSDLPAVSPSLIKWKPVFIEKFDLGIGEEWLPRVGVNEPKNNIDEFSDVTERLSSVPDLRSVLDDKGDSTSRWSSDIVDTESHLHFENGDGSVVKSTKRLKLSRGLKSKATEKKAAINAMKDCTNLSCFVAPVCSPEREKAAKGVIPANTRAN